MAEMNSITDHTVVFRDGKVSIQLTLVGRNEKIPRLRRAQISINRPITSSSAGGAETVIILLPYNVDDSTIEGRAIKRLAELKATIESVLEYLIDGRELPTKEREILLKALG